MELTAEQTMRIEALRASIGTKNINAAALNLTKVIEDSKKYYDWLNDGSIPAEEDKPR
jgi:hypothetical protein